MGEFLEGTTSYIQAGLRAAQPVLVVVSAAKIDRLRAELDGDADKVHFADMAEVGINPARIIPAWREFVTDYLSDDRPVRGIGEPIWAGRSADELVECERHEALLNLAFADSPSWRLLCPYDTTSLDRAVIDEAHRNHPRIVDNGVERGSPTYRGLESVAAPFSDPLPDPPIPPDQLMFGGPSLASVRRFAARQATGAGLGPAQADDLVLAVNEVATNSLRYGGGEGTLRIWEANGSLICEISDQGHITEPLVGRVRPALRREGGRGLWLANQLCDLVQVRSFRDGGVVRLHMRLP
jgi:anti-sigma regulatory factor (Ser/Thr protein kinase)